MKYNTYDNLYKLIDEFSIGIVILNFDKNLTIKYVNDEFCKIFNIENISLEKKNCSFLKILDDLNCYDFIDKYKQELKKGDKIQTQIRIKNSGYKTKIINLTGVKRDDKSGKCEIHCMVTEANDSDLNLDLMQPERKFHNIIKKLFDGIVFYLNLETCVIEHYGKSLKDFNIIPRLNGFPNSIIECNCIFKEDIPIFRKMVENMRIGICEKIELRMCTSLGETQWFCIEYDLIFNNFGKPIAAQGQITNINNVKELEKKALTDPLTKLLNKKAIQKSIEKTLKNDFDCEKHALLVVDIDNFKQINDTLGHHFGDFVLVELAERMKGLFRDSDFVGRIGGDEFIVFMRNIKDFTSVVNKAELLTKILRRSYHGESREITISGSIGISIYPNHGMEFEELYKKADCALYISKENGKDSFTFYDNKIKEVEINKPKNLENTKRFLPHYFENEILLDIFDLLYETKETSITVNKILEIMGKTFNVDRCYIFQTEKNGSVYNNTYEWCIDEKLSEKESLQNLSCKDIEYIISRYNSEGIFYSNEISNMEDELSQLLNRQGIQSILQCAIKVGGVIQVVVGFDDCTSKRIWNEKEISTLFYASKILGLHIINKKNIENIEMLYTSRNGMLENMGAFVYVIDINNHEMLFVNKMVREIAPNVKCGDKCHQVAFGHDQDCEVCPVKCLNENNRYATVEIYNPRYDLYTLASATRVMWEDVEDAALVCCIDITNYKKQMMEA